MPRRICGSRHRGARLAESILVLASLVGLGAGPQTQNLLPPLGPAIPRLRFHTGHVTANQPEISSALPDIPGKASPWFVAQWNGNDVLEPDHMMRGGSSDPLLGRPEYAFTSAGGSRSLAIYPRTGSPVFRLSAINGELVPGGGSDLFLTTDVPNGGLMIGPDLIFYLRARLAKASISYATPSAEQTGAVLGMAFAGFVVSFRSPVLGKPSTLFLQIPLATSRGKTTEYRTCSSSRSGAMTLLFSGQLLGDPRLPFRDDVGELRSLHYSLNDYLLSLVDKPLDCVQPGGKRTVISLNRVSAWRIRGVYIGLETENRDLRPNSSTRGPQGRVAMSLDLSEVSLQK